MNIIILEALAALEIDITELSETTNFKNDIGMDSQEIIELHCVLEKLVEKKLPDFLIKNSTTIGQLSEKLKLLV